jgi:glycosyltransferase involved in cell wall biosynthesis
LAFERDQEFTLLFLSPPDLPAGRRPHRPDEPDVRFLVSLASLEMRRASVAEIFDQMGLDAYLQQPLAQDANVGPILRQARQMISSRLEASGVSITPSHGDYAPWNTLELADGSMFVIDWEYGQRRAAALTDLFHRVLMPTFYVSQYGPREVVDELFGLALDPVLSPVVAASGVAAEEFKGYVLLYLLGQLVGGRHGRHDDRFLLEMIEHAIASAREIPPRKKILAIAYACEPGHGSEPGVGWRMCEVISREHEVWVITRRNNREGIERALAQHQNPYLHFNYTDLPSWARFWKKGERGIRLYYYLWQFAALRVTLGLARKVKFDLAHHVTFVNDYLFTCLALQPIPFVWGPIGSPGKRPALLRRNSLRLLLGRREYYTKVMLRAIDPLFWLTAIRARVVIGVNHEVLHRFPISVLARHKCVCHTAIGVEEELMAQRPRNHGASGAAAFHVLSMGTLIRIKGFDLSIRAFAVLAQSVPSARLSIVGDGPLKNSLVQLTTELGIREQVDFVGHLPRADAMARMGEADVFLFPSWEAEGMVVLEALAQGLPVIGLAYGGPGSMVSPQCGFTVPVGPQAVEAMAAALNMLASDRALIQRMSDAAREHIRAKYLWERRHQAVAQWYRVAGMVATSLPARTDVADRDPTRVGCGDRIE